MNDMTDNLAHVGLGHLALVAVNQDCYQRWHAYCWDKHSELFGGALHDALADEISKMNGASLNDGDGTLCMAKSVLYEKTNNGYIYGMSLDTLEKYLDELVAKILLLATFQKIPWQFSETPSWTLTLFVTQWILSFYFNL